MAAPQWFGVAPLLFSFHLLPAVIPLLAFLPNAEPSALADGVTLAAAGVAPAGGVSVQIAGGNQHSVEQRDHPEYRGKPIVVGGLPEGR